MPHGHRGSAGVLACIVVVEPEIQRSFKVGQHVPAILLQLGSIPKQRKRMPIKKTPATSLGL